jgi:hypothetical protein
MTCPPEVARVVLQILTVAVLRIRAQGWNGDGLRCAVEADHVHNLPALLSNYSDELLKFYWEVERPSFMKRCAAGELTGYEPLWAELAELVPAGSETGPVSGSLRRGAGAPNSSAGP